ncbi:glutamate racemase [Arboricoccus pini]|uniref:Glutamate racemase n=1 Tax=Arboricoccus pini TaxID=1963835 RepID=A0A212QQC2_9PROT|nr:aspartate/glutamate racemase family protein [Arboricoccus pini]SNB61687.1 glutamate racemase [Arboricoccus pini]
MAGEARTAGRKRGTSAMIGVFDSGHGGLTVQRHLSAILPGESFLYLGDHARAPYGSRPPGEVLAFTQAACARLFEHGCGLVILACNTAATRALRPLQQVWLPRVAPERRILGIVVPTIEAMTGMPWAGGPPLVRAPLAPATIGVFGTKLTVESDVYPIEVAKRAPEVSVIQEACLDLAMAIERDAAQSDLEALVRASTTALLAKLQGRRLDAVALACTHYPLVASLFMRHLPPATLMLSQGELTALSLRAYLERHPRFRRQPGEEPGCRYLTTGDPAAVTRIATRFAGQPVPFATA